MKKLFVIACVALMVMGLAASAMAVAFDTDWKVSIKAMDENNLSFNGIGQFGTKGTGTDAYLGTEDVDLPTLATDLIDVYTVIGTKKLTADYRAPMAAGRTITWNLTVAPESASTATGIRIRGWIQSQTGNKIDTDSVFNVKLYSVAAFGGARTQVWAPVNGVAGTSSANYWDSGLLSASTHLFELEATAVPEPGSIVALLSGMVGLVGFGIRRRK